MSLTGKTVDARPLAVTGVEKAVVEEENHMQPAEQNHLPEEAAEAPGFVENFPGAVAQTTILRLCSFQPLELSDVELNPVFEKDDDVIVPHLGSMTGRISARGFNGTNYSLAYLLYGPSEGHIVRSCHIVLEKDILKPAARVGDTFRLGYYDFDGMVESITVVERFVDAEVYRYLVRSTKGGVLRNVSESFMVQMVELRSSMDDIRRRAAQRRAEHRRRRSRRNVDPQGRDASEPL